MSITWLILPDFLLIALGWSLYRFFGFTRELFTGLEKLIYYVLFPALLLHSILKAPITPATAGEIAIATTSLSFAGYILAAIVGRIIRAPSRALASSIQTAFRFNTYLGLAIAQALAGPEGVSLMALYVGLSVPVGNMLAVYALAREQKTNILMALMRNPLLLATVAGLCGNLAGFQLPDALSNTLGRLGTTSIALGILCIGPSLNWQASRGKELLISSMLFIRLLIMPLVALGLGLLMKFPPLDLQMLVLFGTLPCATTAYVLAVRMNGDGQVVSLIISAGTILSAITIPIWMNFLL